MCFLQYLEIAAEQIPNYTCVSHKLTACTAYLHPMVLAIISIAFLNGVLLPFVFCTDILEN